MATVDNIEKKMDEMIDFIQQIAEKKGLTFDQARDILYIACHGDFNRVDMLFNDETSIKKNDTPFLPGFEEIMKDL